MFQKFMMKQMMKRQLKQLPEDQQERIMAAVDKNPDLFQTIAKEIQQKIKKENKDQMAATMEVMQKHKDELRKAMG